MASWADKLLASKPPKQSSWADSLLAGPPKPPGIESPMGESETEPDAGAIAQVAEAPKIETELNPLVTMGKKVWSATLYQMLPSMSVGLQTVIQEGLKGYEWLAENTVGRIPGMDWVAENSPLKDAPGIAELQRKYLLEDAVAGAEWAAKKDAELTKDLINNWGEVHDTPTAINWGMGALSQLAPQIVAAVYTGGGSAIGQEIGSIYMDNLRNTAKEHGITPEQVVEQNLDEPAVAIVAGTAAGLLEYVGAKGAMGRWGGEWAKKWMQTPAGKAFRMKMAEAARTTTGRIVKKGVSVTAAGAGEAGTEGPQALIEHVGSVLKSAKTLEENIAAAELELKKPDTWEDFLESMRQGGVGGVGVKGARVVTGAENKIVAPSGLLGKYVSGPLVGEDKGDKLVAPEKRPNQVWDRKPDAAPVVAVETTRVDDNKNVVPYKLIDVGLTYSKGGRPAYIEVEERAGLDSFSFDGKDLKGVKSIQEAKDAVLAMTQADKSIVHPVTGKLKIEGGARNLDQKGMYLTGLQDAQTGDEIFIHHDPNATGPKYSAYEGKVLGNTVDEVARKILEIGTPAINKAQMNRAAQVLAEEGVNDISLKHIYKDIFGYSDDQVEMATKKMLANIDRRIATVEANTTPTELGKKEGAPKPVKLTREQAFMDIANEMSKKEVEKIKGILGRLPKPGEVPPVTPSPGGAGKLTILPTPVPGTIAGGPDAQKPGAVSSAPIEENFVFARGKKGVGHKGAVRYSYDSIEDFIADTGWGDTAYKELFDYLKGKGIKIDFDFNAKGEVKGNFSTLGYWNRISRKIVVYNVHPLDTLGHEAIHAVLQESGAWNNKDFVGKIRSMQSDLKKLSGSPKYAQFFVDKPYTHNLFRNPEEVVTYAFTKPEFAKLLASLPASTNAKPGDTMWARLKEIVLSHIKGVLKLDNNKLDELNGILDEYVFGKKEVVTEPKPSVPVEPAPVTPPVEPAPVEAKPETPAEAPPVSLSDLDDAKALAMKVAEARNDLKKGTVALKEYTTFIQKAGITAEEGTRILEEALKQHADAIQKRSTTPVPVEPAPGGSKEVGKEVRKPEKPTTTRKGKEKAQKVKPEKPAPKEAPKKKPISMENTPAVQQRAVKAKVGEGYAVTGKKNLKSKDGSKIFPIIEMKKGGETIFINTKGDSFKNISDALAKSEGREEIKKGKKKATLEAKKPEPEPVKEPEAKKVEEPKVEPGTNPTTGGKLFKPKPSLEQQENLKAMAMQMIAMSNGPALKEAATAYYAYAESIGMSQAQAQNVIREMRLHGDTGMTQPGMKPAAEIPPTAETPTPSKAQKEPAPASPEPPARTPQDQPSESPDNTAALIVELMKGWDIIPKNLTKDEMLEYIGSLDEFGRPLGAKAWAILAEMERQGFVAVKGKRVDILFEEEYIAPVERKKFIEGATKGEEAQAAKRAAMAATIQGQVSKDTIDEIKKLIASLPAGARNDAKAVRDAIAEAYGLAPEAIDKLLKAIGAVGVVRKINVGKEIGDFFNAWADGGRKEYVESILKAAGLQIERIGELKPIDFINPLTYLRGVAAIGSAGISVVQAGVKLATGNIDAKYFSPRAKRFANWAADHVKAGLASKHFLIRKINETMQGFYRGLAYTTDELLAQGRFRGKRQEGALLAQEWMNDLYTVIGRDPQKLQRVHAALDPEVYQNTEYADVNRNSLSEDELIVYSALRANMDNLHEWSHKAGYISDETYIKYKDKYFGRAYEEFFNETMGSDVAQAAGALTADFSIYKQRKDFKEIGSLNIERDPVYIAAQRMATALSNEAVTTYAEQIYQNKAVARFSNRDEWVKAGSPAGFTQLGKHMGIRGVYGSLSGMYVPNYIAYDFMGFFMSNSLANKGYRMLKAYDRLWIRRTMKKLLTTYNPTVRLGNNTTNYTFAMVNGIDTFNFNLGLHKAIESIKNKDELYKALVAEGLVGSGVMTELRKTAPTRVEIERQEALNKKLPSAARNTKELFGKAQESLEKSYANVDDKAKIAAYWVKTHVYGMSHQQAIEEIQQGFQNYSAVGMYYDIGSMMPFVGNAFAKFTGDLVRIVGTSVLYRPLATASYLGLIYAMSELTSWGSDEDDYEKEIRQKRPFQPKIPLLNLPLGFKFGKYEVNMARLIAPFQVYDKGGNESGIWSFTDFLPIRSFVASSNGRPGYLKFEDPLLGPMASLIYDKDFRGISPGDPKNLKTVSAEGRTWNQAEYLLRSFGFLPATATDVMHIAATGQDYYGRRKDFTDRMISMVIRVEEFDTPQVKEAVVKEIDARSFEINHITKEIRVLQWQAMNNIKRINLKSVTPDQKARLIEQEVDNFLGKLGEYNEQMRDATARMYDPMTYIKKIQEAEKEKKP